MVKSPALARIDSPCGNTCRPFLVTAHLWYIQPAHATARNRASCKQPITHRSATDSTSSSKAYRLERTRVEYTMPVPRPPQNPTLASSTGSTLCNPAAASELQKVPPSQCHAISHLPVQPHLSYQGMRRPHAPFHERITTVQPASVLQDMPDWVNIKRPSRSVSCLPVPALSSACGLSAGFPRLRHTPAPLRARALATHALALQGAVRPDARSRLATGGRRPGVCKRVEGEAAPWLPGVVALGEAAPLDLEERGLLAMQITRLQDPLHLIGMPRLLSNSPTYIVRQAPGT